MRLRGSDGEGLTPLNQRLSDGVVGTGFSCVSPRFSIQSKVAEREISIEKNTRCSTLARYKVLVYLNVPITYAGSRTNVAHERAH